MRKDLRRMKNKKFTELRHLPADIEHLDHDAGTDGVDRRGFLKCMAWAGTGMLWTVSGGVLASKILNPASASAADAPMMSGFNFAQISDSHIGFNKAANPDVVGTLKEAIARINALPTAPDFILHTGDLSHLSAPDEFDTLEQLLKTTKTGRIFYVPGEHDVLNDNGKQYRDRFGKDTKGDGWFSFDHNGVHFIGLVNMMNLKAGGLGSLGAEQLEWLEDDVAHLTDSTPIVVFAHVPLWTIYPDWGWGTDDAAQALSYLKRFGSVTVLNGHIHQVQQKIEGQVSFHTAMSTAFPQPQPGAAPSPGPMKVPAEKLRGLLGLTSVNYVPGDKNLAVVDSTLAGA
jgi:3',5'-cyclic-AMP phosphodiesterase